MEKISTACRVLHAGLSACLIGVLLAPSAHGTSPQWDVYQRSGARRNWNSPIQVAPAAVLQPAAHGAAGASPSPLPVGANGATARSLSLSPSSINHQFAELVNLTVTGLSTGETVRLEKFQVNNTNGVIDANAVLQESYLLTDGVRNILGGVTNFTATADLTPADGVIRARLDYQKWFLRHIISKYVFRLSSPSGQFAPLTARFTVTPASLNQSISGQVRTPDDVAVPGAYVALIDPSTYEFFAGTIADQNGGYALFCPPHQYLVVAYKPGYVGVLSTRVGGFVPLASTVYIEDGDHIPGHTVYLVAAPRHISGKVVDRDNPGQTLPGVMVLLRQGGNSYFTLAFTDTNGVFSAAALAAPGIVEVLPFSSSPLGYAANYQAEFADTTGGDVNDVVLALRRADTLIQGTVQSTTNAPLGNVDLLGISSDGQFWASATTDGNGHYVLAVPAGTWSIRPLEDSLAWRYDHAGNLGNNGVPVNAGQPLLADFSVQPNTADIGLRIRDQSGFPVSVPMFAIDGAARALIAAYPGDAGSANLRVPAGVFQLIPSLQGLAGWDRIAVRYPNIVVADDDVVLPIVRMVRPTRHLTVHVTDDAGQPARGFPLYASAIITNTLHESARYTDAAGLATLATLDGQWTLRSNPALGFGDPLRNGYEPYSNAVVQFSGADITNQLVVQRALVARDDAVFVGATAPARIPIATLLTNDHSYLDEPLVFKVKSPSAGGGIIVRDGDLLLYTPSLSAQSDSFDYTLRNSFGHEATATVNVTIVPAILLHLSRQSGGLALNFAGVAGKTYRVQFTGTLPATNWVPLGAFTADGAGLIRIENLQPAGATRFYRVVFP